MIKRTLLILFVLLLTSVTATYAQEITEDSVATEQNESAWMDLWTRVQTIRMERMKTSLKLNDETMARLAPQLIQFDTKKREVGKERLQLLRELKKQTKEKVGEDKLQETLTQIEANHVALEEIKRETKAHLAAHLTPQQQAQYILFQRNFNAQLRDLIQKERRAKR